jgi:hypothetical protein
LNYGLRYELNTTPREVNGKIEKDLGLGSLPPIDLSQSLTIGYWEHAFIFDLQQLNKSFENTVSALRNVLGGRKAIFQADRNNFGPYFGFAWDPFANSRTQNGKTAVRGGIGMHYDLTLGNIVSQARNTFPNAVPFNVDVNTFRFSPQFRVRKGSGVFDIFNPLSVPLFVSGNPWYSYRSLNTVAIPSESTIRPLLGLLFNPSIFSNLPSGGGLAFTLPEHALRSPYALNYNLQIEREFFGQYLANVAYVGSRGVKLTRFRTPNGGTNTITRPVDPFSLADNTDVAIGLPPLSDIARNKFSRPNPHLGAYTIFDSSAASTYHSLQASVTRRFAKELQFTASYTWSHAIDDVSDVFDLAGAYNLPQDDRDLRAERGSANFDVRHRFVTSFIYELPLGQGKKWGSNWSGMMNTLLGNWQMASIITYQTGQPFSLNTSYDVNLDGNLTDRPNTTKNLSLINDGPQRLLLTTAPTNLLAPAGQNGHVGRNTFRAPGVAKTDIALIKNLRLSKEPQSARALVLRVEAFNLWNRTHFATPVRILDAPSFGRSVNTAFDARQIQFALKLTF